MACRYINRDGSPCSVETPSESKLCFWHHPSESKEGPEIKEKLQTWAQTGHSMEGFILRYARLEDINFSSRQGVDLRDANLFRANLQGASMWNVNLDNAELIKANLAGANLNEASMKNTDLLGANIDGTRLERVDWGGPILQEKKARLALNSGQESEANTLFEEAEEVYRNVRRTYDSSGNFEMAGHFSYGEMVMRRMMMPRWSFRRGWSKLVDLLCAYGYSPPRVIGASAALVLLCATIFFSVGVKGPDGIVGYMPQAGWGNNIAYFSECIYYSIVTFTTLGYGDITPQGLARPVAALEAFAGAFMMALFIAVFGKKMLH